MERVQDIHGLTFRRLHREMPQEVGTPQRRLVPHGQIAQGRSPEGDWVA